ncbi:MAG: hypothetical protein IPJ98_24610 [Bryobacterales bacterium]|nr:hypothetical protein [Bryobacterales bacterium]
MDNSSFTLNGFGEAPAPLPALRFSRSQRRQEALQQPAVGLAIASASACPSPARSRFAFNSDVFANDPSVRSPPARRTLTFLHPRRPNRRCLPQRRPTLCASKPEASPAPSPSRRPSPDTGIQPRPATPPFGQPHRRRRRPRILSAIVSAKTASSITSPGHGYTTAPARSPKSTSPPSPASPANPSPPAASPCPPESAFLGWFQGAGSAQYGSLFTVTIPLTSAAK